MATWQHPFRIKAAPGGNRDSDALAARLDEILTSGSGWSLTILQWGDVERTVFEMDLDQDAGMTEALFRLDLRGDWRRELAAVWEACAATGYRFHTVPEETPVETLADATLLTTESNAARYFRDPRKFLDDLGSGGD